MAVEPLEVRALLAASLNSAGLLTVTGTAAADVIGMRTDATSVRVVINNQLSKFPIASVKSISIDLGEGDDRLDVGLAMPVYVLGGLGNDTINGGIANDTITAGGGRDSVDGSLGDDRIDGGPTPDFLFGNGGADRIYGSDASDTLSGGSGVDRLFGGLGNDKLYGGSSADKLYGDDGDDALSGNTQNDLLTGGEGNDFIYGGDGNDTLNGQNGNDSLSGQGDLDTVYGDAGNDTLDGGGGSDSLTGGDDPDSIIGSDGDDTLIGQGGDDTLRGDDGKDFIDGGDGADTMFGGANRDWLTGGAGNDGLIGGRDEDSLTGGAGADRFILRGGDQLRDRESADAAPNFTDSNERFWSDDEIEELDKGMAMLVARTNNTKMLKLSGGGDVTVRRIDDAGVDILADNLGDGTIRIADLTFDYTDAFATMIHELGHNWDTDDENPTAKQFFDLSTWRGDDSRGWTHDPNAVFANSYGETNPYEDFATSLEVYFSHTKPKSQWLAKWTYMDNFLNSMSS